MTSSCELVSDLGNLDFFFSPDPRQSVLESVNWSEDRAIDALLGMSDPTYKTETRHQEAPIDTRVSGRDHLLIQRRHHNFYFILISSIRTLFFFRPKLNSTKSLLVALPLRIRSSNLLGLPSSMPRARLGPRIARLGPQGRWPKSSNLKATRRLRKSRSI